MITQKFYLFNKALYREKFKPSSTLNKPYAMVCVNVIAAESERDARFLFTSVQQQFLNLPRGQPRPLPEPVQDMGSLWSPAEQFGVDQALRLAIMGDNSKVQHGLRSLLRETKADEIMINGQIFDHRARKDSFERIMQIRQSLFD